MNRTARLGCWLAAAWLVPIAAHAVGLDVVLPVLLLIATASVLRVGGMLDRIVVASGALFAATCVAGLVLSVWPWHFSTVPGAGTALSGLVVIGAVTGRRPRLGGPPGWPDAGVLLTGATAAVVGWAPLVGWDLTGRLAVMFTGEDLSRHFGMFDGISRFGGYLYLHSGSRDVIDSGFVVYPQGSHLVAAVLDRFRNGDAAPHDTFSAFANYVDWTVASYVWFAVCLAWAVRWVAKELLRGWWAVPVFAVVLGCVCFGPVVSMLSRGYPAQLCGLALLVLVVALAARPPATGLREQLVVLCALFAAIGFTYYFYLPVAGVPIALWMVRHGKSLLRAGSWAVPVVVVALGLAAVGPIVNGEVSQVNILTYGGPVFPIGRVLLLGLGVLAVVPFVLRPALRRDAAWRTVAVTLLAAAAFAAVLWAAQRALGRVGVAYYVEKGLYAVLVVELILVAWVGAVVASRTTPLRVLAGLFAAVLVLAGFGALDPAGTRWAGFPPGPAAGESFGRAYLEGRLRMQPEAHGAVAAIRSEPPAGGRLVIFWNAYGRGADFYTAQFANALLRRMDSETWRALVEIPKPRRGGELERLLDSLGSTPVKLVTTDPAGEEWVRRYRARHPGADVVVLRLPRAGT